MVMRGGERYVSVMSTTSRPILLVETDARTVALVQKTVEGLIDAHPLVVFSDPEAVRRYLVDATRRPVAILLNGQHEGVLSLMSWINSAMDTPVIYFGPYLGLPNFYRVDTLAEPLTEDVVTGALTGALAEAS
jgi:hypothetical protein